MLQATLTAFTEMAQWLMHNRLERTHLGPIWRTVTKLAEMNWENTRKFLEKISSLDFGIKGKTVPLQALGAQNVPGS